MYTDSDCVFKYAVNSYSFLYGCWRDIRMTAIMMMTAIMAMPITSTQLARTEPTAMTIEILFDDEPYSEIQTHNSYAYMFMFMP